MVVETETDRLAMLNVEEFGIAVTLFPNTSNSRVISAIFDAEHIEIDNGISVVSDAEPLVTVQTSDVTDVTQNAILAIDGVNYTVADIRPDGTGITVLRLHLQ